jgi:hypothetical protein
VSVDATPPTAPAARADHPPAASDPRSGSVAGAADASGERLAPFATGPVLAIAAVVVVVMTVGAARYGYHRDELYYLWGGEHLDWGFVDHPPLVPLLARALDVVGGHTLVPLRLAAALVVGWLAVAGALIARELGGGRRAQILAGFAVAVAPATRGPELLFGTTAFDAAVWAAVLVLVVRLLRTGSTRSWLAIGLVVGIGLETKWSVLLLVVALVAGIVLSDRRALVRSPYAVLGGVVALVLWAPNLWWNAANGWPALEFQASVADEYGALDQRLLFVPMLLLLTGIVTVVVWGPGLVALVRGSLGSAFRPLGLAALVLVALVVLSGGKPYYVAPYLVVLFGAGAVVLDRVGGRRVRVATILLAVLAVLSVPALLPVLPPSALVAVEPINAELGEMVGWPALAHQVEEVARSLPDDEAAHAVVLTSNYGTAGAIDRMAPELTVHSAHNSLWYAGPPPATATTVITVGMRASRVEQFCGSVEQVGVIDNEAGDANDEHGGSILVCRDLARPWDQLWNELRHFE